MFVSNFTAQFFCGNKTNIFIKCLFLTITVYELNLNTFLYKPYADCFQEKHKQKQWVKSQIKCKLTTVNGYKLYPLFPAKNTFVKRLLNLKNIYSHYLGNCQSCLFLPAKTKVWLKNHFYSILCVCFLMLIIFLSAKINTIRI